MPKTRNKYERVRAVAEDFVEAPPERAARTRSTVKPWEQDDIRAVAEKCKANRDKWTVAARSVPNPHRFYVGFRGLGLTVILEPKGEHTTLRTSSGKPVKLFDVWVTAKSGKLTPVFPKSPKAAENGS